MKIIHLAAENVKKISAVEITPEGSVVQITGKNGAGKSTVLDSILYALAGGKVLPKEPLRRGAKEGHIKLDLDELLVTRKFSEGGGTQLIVESKTGARYSSPQRMLDELLGKISFDPLAFSRMDAKQQFDALRAIAKLDVDLEALAGKNKTDFENRTSVNRNAKALRAQADGIKVPEGLPDAPVDVDALLWELTQASETNTKIERARNAREATRVEINHIRGEAEKLEASAKRMREQAEVLEEQLKTSPTLPETIDVQDLRKRIDEGRTVNLGLQTKVRRDELVQQAAAEEKKAADLTLAIEARNKERDTALAAAKMPIDEISLGEGAVLYKGLPFEQASSAEQLRVSVAIAMASNPKLRIMLIKEGGLLDEDGMKILREMTAAADYQCWIETVHANGPVTVEMVDGHAKGAPPATAKAVSADLGAGGVEAKGSTVDA